MVAVILLSLFLILIIFRVPICLSMGIATLVSIIAGGYEKFLFIIPQQMVEGTQNPPLLAIPFFIMAGNILNEAGLTDMIFNFATKIVGHIRGGLAQVNVLASMIFAGISGAAVADAAGLGVIEVKAMTERGYSKQFSAAITAASSTIGPIIPPSIPLVIYAFIANESVGRMFLAGVIPGTIIGISLMITNYVLSFKKNFPREVRPPVSEILRIFKKSLPALFAPLIVLGSIVTGIVTATEAGVLGAAYAMIVGFKCGNLTLKKLWKVMYETMIVTVVIMFIIAIATSLGWLLAIEKIPAKVAEMMLSITPNKYFFLSLLIIFLLLIGTVVEGIPALIITLPVLLPLADNFGIDRVHFGMIVVYGILIGVLTPPMGIVLYIMTEIAGISFEEVTKAVIPFLIPLIVVLFMITYIPPLTTFLPNLLMGR